MTDMSRPRASRLSQPPSARRGLFSSWLPYGSIWRKLFFGAFVPLVILLVSVVFVDKCVMPIVTRQGSEFPLPDFTGQTVMEAQIALTDLELKHEIASEEYSPGKPQGMILQQFPRAGTRVKPDRSIKFVISLGQKLITIPELAGKSVRQAMLDLETAGLTLGEIQMAFSDTIPERVVVFSYPSAGMEIPLGSMVNLMVNRGRASNFTFMPQLEGKTLDEAVKLLDDKSLKQGILSYRVDENFLPETVLEQSEPVGAELDVGTEIDLVVSST